MGDFGHDFVALSYVWGSNTKPVLTQSTKDKYLEIGSLSRVNVPPTIWDIMDLVSDLGEQYLWVDSVCIVQDELSDKRKYLPIMGEIYDNAKLVVVAAVKDAHSGIPGRGDNQRRWTRNTERIQGIDFTNGGPMLCHRLETTTWNTRGWTYQEAQLARRALIITDSQVYWNCREETWREERFAEFQNLRFVPASQDSLFTGTAPEALGRGYALTTVPCSLGTYCDKVYEFSMRLFTDSRDALWACVGILKSLLPEFPQGYIWGIPKVNLDAALLWEAYGPWKYREPLKIPIPIANGGWQELMIPSWSWISEASTVRYSVCRVRVKPMVEWHDPVPFEKLGLLSETREREQEGMESPQSTIFLDQLSSERSIFDFALLHFTAQSTILKIRRPLSLKPVTGCIHYIVRAKIGLLSGRNIGSIRIPLGTFSGHNEIQGEFLLLSRSGTDQYGHELEEQKYNIMLIRWSDDNKLAYRVTWTEVRKSDWEECETQRKTIILG
ncbi:heterokaryon incompatibility protein-domain-containing protein [Hypomontagnella monticulosa]|nr:heterokaryon incompatibility protein-domain-containing protein [Hypomontagnella monticulosa]